MRFLIACGDPETFGGLTRSLRRLSGALRAAGHEAILCHASGAVFPGECAVDETAWMFGAADDPQRHVDELLEAGRVLRPDVVIGWYGSRWGVAGVAAARLLGVPSIVCLRGNDLDRDFFDTARHGPLVWAVRGADAVTTVSREMARKVEAWLERPAVFIANATDRSVFYPDPEAGRALRARWGLGDEKVLGVFGEIKPKRGVARLARLDLTGWRVVVVGRVRPGLEHALPPGTLVRRAADDWELRAAYAACDAVAQPSLHDGMPNVVLEAQACGRLVIGTPVGGIADAITHGISGLLCTSDAEWQAALDAPPDLDPVAAPRAPSEEAGDFVRLAEQLRT